MIPNARLRVIDASGHMSPAEQPEAVAEILTAWMIASVGEYGSAAAS